MMNNVTKKLYEGDYVLYNSSEDFVVRWFSSKDIIIYNDISEALMDCGANEAVYKCTDLPIHWQEELLQQINRYRWDAEEDKLTGEREGERRAGLDNDE
jgi:hypothetical protein